MAEDDLRDKLIQILKDGGTHEQTLCALRTVIEQNLKAGAKREPILTTMEELRKSVLDEQEDILLEVMDFLVSGCSPHMKLRKTYGCAPRLSSASDRCCRKRLD